uniref:MACPF domain-containing protein CAD1-like n=1 Tax=Nelumbo nucifera TaxID=4432 RepID=A0A822ZTF5_NELNU|nr:TPA_asm: hypothetical protein HUJ06_018094 [Nelumbo nucifera]
MENPATTSSSAALATTLCNAIQALGRGFDVTSDVRLLYCKGAPGSRLVHLDENNTRDLLITDDLVLPNVSFDIELFSGKGKMETRAACSFHEVIFRWISLLGSRFF